MSRSVVCAFVVGFCALLATGTDAQQLRWRSGSVLERPVRGGIPRTELVRRLAEGGERHVLVRFQRAPSAHEQELWRALE
ncbi:MAG: hypothetical protein HOP15_00825, partial [Planctomycetes bacterium]|nr:hypothetical protein [Planctomycetota bacterium]